MENQQGGKDGNTEKVITRTTSPLTAPPLPTTKRPLTPSNPNQPPEPPPIHSIPSMRPIAHVRPTKPPIITPLASNSSPIAEPRNVDSWRKIEDRIWSVLKEEDFSDYLITHYTKEVMLYYGTVIPGVCNLFPGYRMVRVELLLDWYAGLLRRLRLLSIT